MCNGDRLSYLAGGVISQRMSDRRFDNPKCGSGRYRPVHKDIAVVGFPRFNGKVEGHGHDDVGKKLRDLFFSRVLLGGKRESRLWRMGQRKLPCNDETHFVNARPFDNAPPLR
jgi:hypothetical protein